MTTPGTPCCLTDPKRRMMSIVWSSRSYWLDWRCVVDAVVNAMPGTPFNNPFSSFQKKFPEEVFQKRKKEVLKKFPNNFSSVLVLSRQRTEDRGQKTENREQKTEDRGHRNDYWPPTNNALTFVNCNPARECPRDHSMAPIRFNPSLARHQPKKPWILCSGFGWFLSKYGLEKDNRATRAKHSTNSGYDNMLCKGFRRQARKHVNNSVLVAKARSTPKSLANSTTSANVMAAKRSENEFKRVKQGRQGTRGRQQVKQVTHQTSHTSHTKQKVKIGQSMCVLCTEDNMIGT